MNLIDVKSSHIKSVAHEGTTLYVLYDTGKKYSWSGVSEAQFKAILNASSVGRAVTALGRPGKPA